MSTNEGPIEYEADIHRNYKQPVRVFGQWMVMHDFERDRWISPFLASGKLFEPFETEWMQNFVRAGDTVLDIGGHIGFYTVLLSRLTGTAGRVLSFEPDPSNFALLQQNVVLNRCVNVSLYNVALSNKAELATLHLSFDNAGDHRIWQAPESRPEVSVRAIVLDEFLDSEKLPVHFIKMDIQGAEVKALEGMRSLLRRQPQITLFTEFWPFGMRGCGSSPATFLQFLTDLQFRLYLIEEQGGRLIRMQAEQLLRIFGEEKDAFGNLVCIKAGVVNP